MESREIKRLPVALFFVEEDADRYKDQHHGAFARVVPVNVVV